MRRWSLAAILVVILLAGASFALAQGGGFDLPWFSVDGGGTTASEGGEFSLASTIGQPDAGTLSGGEFALSGGFQVNSAAPVQGSSSVFLPLVIRPD